MTLDSKNKGGRPEIYTVDTLIPLLKSIRELMKVREYNQKSAIEELHRCNLIPINWLSSNKDLDVRPDGQTTRYRIEQHLTPTRIEAAFERIYKSWGGNSSGKRSKSTKAPLSVKDDNEWWRGIMSLVPLLSELKLKSPELFYPDIEFVEAMHELAIEEGRARQRQKS